jgi:hypothetical protein
MFSICLKIQLLFCSPSGTIPPFLIEIVSSGITFLRLISFVIPKPLQASQAPFGELKENVLGSKKTQQEPAVIKDPASGHIVTDVKEIKRISLKYCIDLLTNGKPKPEYEELIEMKKVVHKERMKEVIENYVEFSEKLFNECLEILKKKNNKKYEFLLRAGSSLKKCLVDLFRYIWTTEDKPEQWRRTTLIQLHKKNSKDVLDHYRNIHTKVDIPKLFGFMVITLEKVPIIQNMSKYQIGTVPGHRSQEHLFVMKRMVSLYSSCMTYRIFLIEKCLSMA